MLWYGRVVVMVGESHLEGLNAAQRAAVTHGIDAAGETPRPGPLLIIAGAGTGKTQTLAHRVAQLVLHGVRPERLLLLTFTRRAAQEMTRRSRRIVAQACSGVGNGRRKATPWMAGAKCLPWSGTFHSVANRLLRLHADAVGLDPAFTVLDRSDAADLMNLVRDDLRLSRKGSRFPRKETCLAIYSHAVNARHDLERSLAESFPWCASWEAELRDLFRAYVTAKQARHVLDYDDLLLYWHALMSEPALAAQVRTRFDHVLADEYQDTNALQAGILCALAPEGGGVTVVGDDFQAIYSFRAATVRNILDFPRLFDPPATVISLEQNYRSTVPILEACNAVIGLAGEGYAKRLVSDRASEQLPFLVSAEDEMAQAEYVIDRILQSREAGIDLCRQAVLFRTGHHADLLEVELGRRGIPYVKFGGLRFLEAAHVKDFLCVLRWAQNPCDTLAAFRILQILPGMGPRYAGRALAHVAANRGDLAALEGFRPPATATADWPGLCDLMCCLSGSRLDWPAELDLLRQWYAPHLERLYDSAAVRAGDLDQLEQIASGFPTRERFLTELTLDPPSASGDEAGLPRLDEDYLILSTIHSAKGQEWDIVYVLNVVDGAIPSDMSTGSPAQIEEERRLLYVAMTRARDQLHLVYPLRFFVRQQRRYGDRHVYAPRTRFIPDVILDRFERRRCGEAQTPDDEGTANGVRVDVASRLRAMW